ncbi:MAG: bifunctional hydroxymethylpyrimidine kinase/phosphomethylpyrimidine kinase [Bacteroidia bacterium]|nr:bifunctional hydroxymethylpyrimidine kinase/phosphomethylpyrimidine kinase [Bacteroidia bacterium]
MKVLLIHSMAVHGTASMKAMTGVLGSKLLPVPSLWLTGLTNIPGHKKFMPPFEEILIGSLQIAQNLNEEICLYVGYLGEKNQVDIILRAIDRYRDIIKMIMVDPVSGDHGRLYVPDEIVRAWPKLIAQADWAFPNFTELKIHSGFSLEEQIEEEWVVERFQQKFPELSFLVTSLDRGNELGILMSENRIFKEYRHEKLDQSFGGTGDLFASYFIDQYIFKLNGAWESLTYAAQQTLLAMKATIEAGESFLKIE